MRIWLAILIVVLCVMPFHPIVEAGDKMITLSELSSTKIMGSLGRPLGAVVTIDGMVVDDYYRKLKSDEGETLLKVEKVDGKALPGETIIPLHMAPSGSIKMPAPGFRFRYKGYETGGFTGVPEEAFRYVPRVATEGFHFKTYFLIISEEKQ